jgi:8-oxo-dGTP pyrophosphatase MutT (NUDIX family)
MNLISYEDQNGEQRNMAYPVRNAVRIVLLNEANELLLMCMDDPTITSIGEEYCGHFWTLIGGEIEPNETVREAAEREVFEETGLAKEDIEFGPQVWFGELDLILYGRPTHIMQKFIVARTKHRNISLANLTSYEKAVVKQVSWFSLERMVNSGEVIHPVILPKYLPDIIAGRYPEAPLEIDLTTEAKI